MPDVTRIRVESGDPYDVLVGRGLLGQLPAVLGSRVRRVAVVHSQALATAAKVVGEELRRAGFAVYPLVVPDGEKAKTAQIAAACWKLLAELSFTRSDAVVGVGGGSTTDLAGFVAATFLRGLTVVQVPTTVLGMVDAAVGGKTGINTAEGKNLVGVFHEPAAVLCDLAWLETLDVQEVRSGLAEVVKCGFIADPRVLELVEADPVAALDVTTSVLRELVERGISVKARVVAGDLKESTSTGTQVGREALNYGHTLGHAIERAEHYSFRHGAAVSVGMVFAAELARLAGRLPGDLTARHRDVLRSVGLPTTYGGATWPLLRDAMRVDKKARGDLMRFVILEDVGRPAILEGPEDALLAAAFACVAA
ncbi:MAG: 3-dehydroquinate synthase [Nocardioidaceae bacterium]